MREQRTTVQASPSVQRVPRLVFAPLSSQSSLNDLMSRLPGTFITTASGRKIVCGNCKARKKKCDGQRPVCSSCRDRSVPCRYPSSSVSNSEFDIFGSYLPTSASAADSAALTEALIHTSADPPISDLNGFFQPPEVFQTSRSTIEAGRQTMLAWPASQQQDGFAWQPDLSNGFLSAQFSFNTPHSEPVERPINEYIPPIQATSLPDLPELQDLVDVYFRRVHHLLPILHRPAFQDILDQSYTETHSRALIFAVISLATCERQESSVIASRVQWYNKAKEFYQETSHVPANPLSTLQTAVCLIFQGMMITDYHSAWLTLAKAWRQIVALGYNRLDSGHIKAMPEAPQLPQDQTQRESIRRVIWTLYILDRGLCFPVGLVHSIEDKYLHVNLPMDEDDFQLSLQHNDVPPTRFMSSFDKLLDTVRENSTLAKRENRLHYVMLAYMLLGRIAAHHHCSDESNQDEKEASFRHLESCLMKLRLCLPRSVTSLSAAPFKHLSNIVWLNIIMNVNTTFLYHGKVADSDSDATGFTHWHSCLTAARNTVALIREAGVISADLLLNPHTASPLFCSSRILIIESLVPTQSNGMYHGTSTDLATTTSNQGVTSDLLNPETSSKDPSLKNDLSLVILVFERLAEAFGPLGTKFKKGVLYHLQQDTAAAAQLKQNGVRDIMSGCVLWGAPPPGFTGAT